MPSGAKKRKAAKKKNLQQNTHSHGEDEVKHYDEKESDGGEISSPASRDESRHPFDKREEVESGKREGSSSAQLIVPESNSVEKEDTQKVATEEEGGVQIEWELKLEEDYKSKNISIESAEVHGGKLTSSSSSSSGSSSSSSDDESHDVENETDVVGTGLVVDSVEPVETGQVVESVELVETLPEVASQVIENGKVEENDDKVIATCSSVKLDDSLLSTVNQVIDDSLLSIVNQVSDSIPARETDNRVAEAVQVVDLAEPTDCSSEVVYEVNDTISSGETRNGDDETAHLVETEKDSLMEDTVEVIDSALTENHNTSCVVELYLPEVTEKEILTLDISNAVAPELVDLGSENKELPTSEKAEVCSDAKDPATDVLEDKLELSYNSHVGHTSNGAELVTNYQNPEYSSNQPPGGRHYDIFASQLSKPFEDFFLRPTFPPSTPFFHVLYSQTRDFVNYSQYIVNMGGGIMCLVCYGTLPLDDHLSSHAVLMFFKVSNEPHQSLSISSPAKEGDAMEEDGQHVNYFKADFVIYTLLHINTRKKFTQGTLRSCILV